MGFLISCVYFYLPAAFANMGAVISRFIPFFNAINTPLDLGKSINGIRIIGDHKTVGGFLFGVLFGMASGIIKYLVFDKHLQDYQLLNLDFTENTVLYLLMSFCALAGDVLKSVAKRLFNIAPHKPWIPFDEIDHSTLSMTMAMVFYGVSIQAVLTVIFLFFFIHIISNLIGYTLKIKSVPY
ncbi:CDP-archaeol synthase [candidate division WWE3 bacterium]|jgi:CDP-2,3-bis-(O-geranylgeranyl)-sn-glycerol synthase|uniref:CDP-archaeol synthase n=1 Tax=candidate division WWE3 bacterium TaxID=2053526 RepID=A0A3A4ZD69_UNCKA|nr:MAG: CDP-archaeol synthase [candidate division WWE3 bacterium]